MYPVGFGQALQRILQFSGHLSSDSIEVSTTSKTCSKVRLTPPIPETNFAALAKCCSELFHGEGYDEADALERQSAG